MKNFLCLLFLSGCFFFIPVTILAWECDVTLDAPKTIKLDQAVTLTAIGTPDDGSYSWSRTRGLTPNGDTATLIGHKPTSSEYIKVIAYYTSPKGKKCYDTAWIWACLCTIDAINGQNSAQIGDEVNLSTTSDPPGGTYTWTVHSGSGSITANDSSAVFIGDTAGNVEIKASYIPPDGGEPCAKYHKIEILGDDCEVTLTANVNSRPICRSVTFEAKGTPFGGNYLWNADHGIKGSGNNATYDSSTTGTDTVIVTYVSPDGTSCNASQAISSFSLNDDFASKKNCFYSGDTLQFADFIISTTPSGYHDEATLSPTTVSTLNPQEEVVVTASLLCQPSSNETFTYISVVNKNITLKSGIELEIPNQLTKPLEFFGLADKLEFSMEATSEKTAECCDDGPGDITTGKISINAKADLLEFPIAYSIPLPKKLKKYFSFNGLAADLMAESSLLIKSEGQTCHDNIRWNGDGNIAVKFGLGSNAKVSARYILIQGEVKGRTDIKQTMTVDSSRITSKGSWGGVVVNGMVTIRVNHKKIKTFEVSYRAIDGDATQPFYVNLPSL